MGATASVAGRSGLRYKPGMENTTLYTISTLLSLVPAAFVACRPNSARDSVFWFATAVAVAGPSAWSVILLSGEWRTGLSSSLWVTIAACMVLYSILAAATREAWRLAPLLIPYLILMGIIAVSSGSFRGKRTAAFRQSAQVIYARMANRTPYIYNTPLGQNESYCKTDSVT